MKKNFLIKMSAVAIIVLIAFTPASAQIGRLKSLGKKVKKEVRKTKKVDKTSNKAPEKKQQSSTWGPSYDEMYPKEESTNQSSSDGGSTQANNQSSSDGGPTQADLAKMNDDIDNILFDFSYLFTAKKMDGDKLYLVIYHLQDKTTTFNQQQLKKIVAARDGVAILEHYNYTGITKEELEKKKKTVADLIEGHNNSVKKANQESSNALKWESHKSKAPGLANAMVRVRKAISKQFDSTMKTLDIAMEDDWTTQSFKDGIHRMKRKVLYGFILFYDTKTKEYSRIRVRVRDLWYIDHPKDVEKTERFDYKRILNKDEHVPRKFWR